MIHLYGVPPIFNIMSTMSFAKYARKIKSTERILSLIGSSASVPSPNPKFLNNCQIQLSKISPIASATNILYMVPAAGKYRRKVSMLHPSEPKTDELIKSSPYITCVAIHSTIPSNMPTASLPFYDLESSVPSSVCEEGCYVCHNEAKAV